MHITELSFVINNTEIQVICSLPVPMRLSEPSVTMSETPCTIFTSSKGINNLYDVTSIKSGAIIGNAIALLFTIVDGITGDPAQLVFKNNSGQYIDFSAEI